jgi:hypothetical protein
MMGSRCFPVPLANIELCDNRNFSLIIVMVQAEKPWNCLSRDLYRKIYSTMQIHMGPGTHRALLKLTFKQESEVSMALSTTNASIYVRHTNFFWKKLHIVQFEIIQDCYTTLPMSQA